MPRRRRAARWPWVLLLLFVAGFASWRWGQAYVRDHPEQFPWTSLSLRDPIGPFTVAKLARLGDDPAQCRALLAAVGDRDRPLPPRPASEPACAFDDATLLVPDQAQSIAFRPALTTACPVAAALRLWEEDRLQDPAMRHLGSRVSAIDTLGSYSCRRLYGQPDAAWSEHATGDAVDIAAFRLADGRRISVLRDWPSDTPEAAFLRAARDGACDLFATVLSPDYNAAHRDHLHLDMARRGASGWSMCR